MHLSCSINGCCCYRILYSPSNCSGNHYFGHLIDLCLCVLLCEKPYPVRNSSSSSSLEVHRIKTLNFPSSHIHDDIYCYFLNFLARRNHRNLSHENLSSNLGINSNPRVYSRDNLFLLDGFPNILFNILLLLHGFHCGNWLRYVVLQH